MGQPVRIAAGAAAVLVLFGGGVVGGTAVLSGVRQAQVCEQTWAYLREYGRVATSARGAPGVAVLGDS